MIQKIIKQNQQLLKFLKQMVFKPLSNDPCWKNREIFFPFYTFSGNPSDELRVTSLSASKRWESAIDVTVQKLDVQSVFHFSPWNYNIKASNFLGIRIEEHFHVKPIDSALVNTSIFEKNLWRGLCNDDNIYIGRER